MATRDAPGPSPSRRHGALEELRRGVSGAVVLPDDPAWETARRAWNLAVDQRPAAVVEAARVDDIQAVVRLARREGLRVAPQATGHGAGPLAALDDAILLKTSRMRGVTVRAEDRVARVEAGALSGDVAEAAGAHGLAAASGLAPTVGAVGLMLGGGVGWLGRCHGLASNNVRAIELVTATGERMRADVGHEPDLFWALRGGGGSFAIVTAMELELHPIAEAFAGTIMWPAEDAPDVLDQYRRWSSDAPETLSSVFRYLAIPDDPAVPAPLRGRRVAAIVAAHLGGEHDGERLLRPLRASGTAIVDTCGPVAASQLVRVAGDPEAPVPALGHGFMVDGLASDLVATLAERIVDDALAPVGVLELRQLGGALGRAPEGHGALAALDGGFLFFASGVVTDPETRPGIEARLGELRETLLPWTRPQALPNWGDLPVDPARAFGADTLSRLRRIHDAYAADGVILASRRIANGHAA